MHTKVLDYVLDRFYKFETQQAYSVVRTLHAQNGLKICGALHRYIRTEEFFGLPLPAKRELQSIAAQYAE